MKGVNNDKTQSFMEFLQSTSKALIWISVVLGWIAIYLSYLLAFLDKIQIAESLSQSVATIVLGQLVVYLITSTVSNIFRYNPKFGGESSYPEDVAARMEMDSMSVGEFSDEDVER